MGLSEVGYPTQNPLWKLKFRLVSGVYRIFKLALGIHQFHAVLIGKRVRISYISPILQTFFATELEILLDYLIYSPRWMHSLHSSNPWFPMMSQKGHCNWSRKYRKIWIAPSIVDYLKIEHIYIFIHMHMVNTITNSYIYIYTICICTCQNLNMFSELCFSRVIFYKPCAHRAPARPSRLSGHRSWFAKWSRSDAPGPVVQGSARADQPLDHGLYPLVISGYMVYIWIIYG